MLCSHLSSTCEVSQALAGYLAPGDQRVLRCQGPRRQSPGRSAAPVIPTRTKSASTTATWISSGSTLLSKIYFCSCPQLPCHARIFRLARHGYLSFVRGEHRGKAITLRQTSGRLVPKKKVELCSEVSVLWSGSRPEDADGCRVSSDGKPSRKLCVMPGNSLI